MRFGLWENLQRNTFLFPCIVSQVCTECGLFTVELSPLRVLRTVERRRNSTSSERGCRLVICAGNVKPQSLSQSLADAERSVRCHWCLKRRKNQATVVNCNYLNGCVLKLGFPSRLGFDVRVCVCVPQGQFSVLLLSIHNGSRICCYLTNSIA